MDLQNWEGEFKYHLPRMPIPSNSCWNIAKFKQGGTVLKTVRDLQTYAQCSLSYILYIETLGVSQNVNENLVLKASALNSFKVSTDSVTTNEGSDSVSYLGLYLAILEEWNCLFQKDVKLANIHVSRLWKLGARFDIACRWLYSYRNWKICMLPHVHFSIYQSVGATENIMVAAVFQEGKTVLIMLQLIWPCSQMLSSSVTFSV